MEYHKQIRHKLISSCLCESSGQHHPQHVDLMGVCGYYILTDCQPLLKYYPLNAYLAKWLLSERILALTGDIRKVPSMIDDRGQNVNQKIHLYAMNTTPDGNCLLHALSICLWGVEDSSSSEVSLMRSALKNFMTTHKELLLLHYKAAEKRFDKLYLGGIETSESEYEKQMDLEIIRLDDNKKYLSALHVFCMANMLRRPVIVYARPNPNGIMRGIYLPTLFNSEFAYPCPLTLTWMDNHFTAVLSSELTREILIPLFDSHGPLDFPYGWIGKNTIEFEECQTRGYRDVPSGLSLPCDYHRGNNGHHDGGLQEKQFQQPQLSWALLDYINPFTVMSKVSCLFVDSLSEPDTMSRPLGPRKSPQSHSSSSHDHDTVASYLSFKVAHNGNGRFIFPYADRVPEHPARQRLLGDGWREFTTVWVGRFKESAWSSLSQAVLRLVVDVHGEGCREDATRLVDDISRLNQQGSISDPRLKSLYSQLIATGDTSGVQDIIFSEDLIDSDGDITIDPRLGQPRADNGDMDVATI